jgi:hypothetical protein
MLRFLADEDFDQRILHGLLRLSSDVDIVTVQQSGLSGQRDPVILAWAAREGRIVLTHDVNTMTKHAYDLITKGEALPGLLLIPQSLPIGRAIEELQIVAECSTADEWEGQVRYLPL